MYVCLCVLCVHICMKVEIHSIVLYPVCVSSDCIVYRVCIFILYCIPCVYLQIVLYPVYVSSDSIVSCVYLQIVLYPVCIFRLYCILCVYLQIVLYPVCVSSDMYCIVSCCIVSSDCIVLYPVVLYLQGHHAESPATDPGSGCHGETNLYVSRRYQR